MPIFATKKVEEPEIPEKIPEVPRAEELKDIARKLREELMPEKAESKIEIKKQKDTEEKPEKISIEELKEIAKKIEEGPKREIKKEEVPEEKIVGPPLFIKLERYHKILRHISELRRTLFVTKSTISTLAEIEKLREDNLKLLRRTIESIDNKLAELDRELLRPKELPEEYPEAATEVKGMESVITDLRSQLQSLKEELESVL
jgi:chromosome segregation ATPase